MLIRDWLENVKCTKRSTAGYHASMLELSLFSTRQPLSLSISSSITPSFFFHLPSSVSFSISIPSSVHLLLLLLVLLLLLLPPSASPPLPSFSRYLSPYSIRPPLSFHRLSLLHLSLSSSVRPTLLSRAPDIYGIFLIARPLHSSLLARRPRSKKSRRVSPSPWTPGTEGTFQSSLRPMPVRGAHRAKLRPGFVAAFRDPPLRYRVRRSR